jgi:hypothetical protein
VSGIYPPLKPSGQVQDKEYTEGEEEALRLWEGLLKDGEAAVYVEDRIDSIRFAKVRGHSNLTILS